MHAELSVPYADTAPGQLSFALDLPELPALETRELAGVFDGGELTLRLLGASHQVVLRTPEGTLTETLACLTDRTPSLPPMVETRVAGMHYRFGVFVESPPTGDFGDVVSTLRQGVARSPYGLVGVFPGDDNAITALLVEPGHARVVWRTWHAYPQTGQLVVTRTTVTAQTEGDPR
ncbi:DUF2617 family protein [Phytomonospora endophytica]|uniref:DUF2617 domain-containing protein n=1 Tax=Phytomonospora endophytica TaxID=714109 RepID=A0A841FP17_9ACTN|nr:DUF2617 family protein [Phytomonospora endophytica]MBB6039061.1 hypothetical protein [Phytomonospora endophytica]GIG71490.1 hypothetical protein Pen01_77850 [Phytomonospora endophytica]